jgi:hypothetical protein
VEYSKRGILLTIVFFVRGGFFLIRVPHKVWKKTFSGTHFDYGYSGHSGRMLYYSYGGDIEYKFSDKQKSARVFWHREKKEVK